MAADSRLSISNPIPQPAGQQSPQPGSLYYVRQTDTNNKLFLAPGNIGISTWGDADIEGVPVTGYLESFIEERLKAEPRQVNEVPAMLIDYFNSAPKVPATHFFVAGYREENGRPVQHVYTVDIQNGQVNRANDPLAQCASWAGEKDVLVKLLNPLYEQDGAGGYREVPCFPIPWHYFTVQDAIDFAVFATRTTIDTLRFQPRPKTVGGPVDVLVIKPGEAIWVQRKELHA